MWSIDSGVSFRVTPEPSSFTGFEYTELFFVENGDEPTVEPGCRDAVEININGHTNREDCIM